MNFNIHAVEQTLWALLKADYLTVYVYGSCNFDILIVAHFQLIYSLFLTKTP